MGDFEAKRSLSFHMAVPRPSDCRGSYRLYEEDHSGPFTKGRYPIVRERFDLECDQASSSRHATTTLRSELDTIRTRLDELGNERQVLRERQLEIEGSLERVQ